MQAAFDSVRQDGIKYLEDSPTIPYRHFSNLGEICGVMLDCSKADICLGEPPKIVLNVVVNDGTDQFLIG